MVGERNGGGGILWRIRVGGGSQSDGTGPCLPASVTWGGQGCRGRGRGRVGVGDLGSKLPCALLRTRLLTAFGECGDCIGRGWQAYGVPQVE